MATEEVMGIWYKDQIHAYGLKTFWQTLKIHKVDGKSSDLVRVIVVSLRVVL